MNNINFFENSIFISKKTQDILNTKINCYFSALAKILEVNDYSAVVSYTGSLARREPSVCFSGRKLCSDIDLMVLKTKKQSNSWDNNFKNNLDRIFPEYKNSVMLFPYKEKRQFQSFIGQDLKQSMLFPVYKSGLLPEIQYVSINERDYFEIIIHQLGNYILNQGYSKNMLLDKGYIYSNLKLVLECLRAQFLSEPNISYNYVYKNRKELNYILEETVIEELIYKREHFNTDFNINLDIKTIVQKSIMKPLDISIKNLNDEKNRNCILLDYISEFAQVSCTLMEKYQYILISYAFFIFKGEYMEEWKQLLIYGLENYTLDFPNLNNIYNREKILKIVRTFDLKEITNILLLMREKYLELLCEKNTQDQCFLDIKR